MTALFFLLVVTLASLAGFILAAAMRRAAVTAVDRERINVAIFRERQGELDAELAAGRITEEQHAELSAELEQMLVGDVDVVMAPANVPGAAVPRWRLLAMVILVPAAALGLYLITGFGEETRNWMTLQGRAADVAALPQPFTEAGVSTQGLSMADAARLTQVSLQRRPADAEAWFRLGITWLDLDAPMLGVEALRTAHRLAPASTDMAITLARVELALNQNRLNDEARALLDAVLAAEPGHQGALMVYGMASFESGEFASAAGYWEQLLAQIDPASAGADLLRRSIDKARGSEQSASQGVKVPVRVVLSANTDQLPPEAALFVVVRAAGGPPMPIVAKKLSPRFPAEIVLTDADQMIPGASLSERGPVEVIARISMRGAPMPGSGDIESAPVRVTFPVQSAVTLTLDRRIP
jgi:cytochrome c-type biogenesis protein CcmH